MKPQHAIAFIVVAVLATVAIEETRISKLRAEIIRLQAIPLDKPSNISEIVSNTEEVIVDSDVVNQEEKPTPPPSETPTETETEAPPAISTGRVIPSDFPEPDETIVKKLALSPYSGFFLDMGLNNRECAYLAELLERRSNTLQDTAGKWMTAPPSERAALEDTMTLIMAKNDEQIATFLGNETDSKAFARYHAMQPEREQLAAMAGALDAAGATLDMDKEQQVIEALYQSRVGTGSLDWNSPAGLKAIGEGGALERFEKEWETQSQALIGLLPKFLSETEAAAALQARETSKEAMVASIESAVEAINRGSE